MNVEPIYSSYAQNYQLLEDYKKDRTAIEDKLKLAKAQEEETPSSSSLCELLSEVLALMKLAGGTNKETVNQSELQGKISWLNQQLDDLNNKISDVYTQLNAVRDKVMNPDEAENLIIEALGGKDAYKSMPRLELGNRMGYQGNIDMISYKDMRAPIMPFRDKLLRKGFAACGIPEGSDQPIVQTFYQHEFMSANWTSSGGQIIPLNQFLIYNGIVSTAALNQLKLFRDGKLPGWKPYPVNF